MIFFYRFLINIIFILSPIILIIRLIKKKEDINRFKEKFCIFSSFRKKGQLIWFHGASVGEIQSILPIIEILEKKNEINQILITSNTVSSSKIISKLKLKKTIHQFFPLDTNFLTKKFLDHWRPNSAVFIDTEIWPNTVYNLNKRDIPLIIINGRISKKSFKRWKMFPRFAKEIFCKFDLCISCSETSKKYFQKLGLMKVKYFGNLKFAQSKLDKFHLDKRFKKFISKKKVWIASSTHPGEEKMCVLTHQNLKKKYKNLLTIIIPRHIERVPKIGKEINNMGLKTHVHKPYRKVKNKTDVYLVNSYGETKSFFSICKNIFLGGSIIPHGGQNPLEAAKYGCNILHGPHVSNFRDIYAFLEKHKISNKFNTSKKMINILDTLFLKKTKSEIIKKKIDNIGKRILYLTYKELNLFIKKNEVKKT
jgi:3-deoxy-D-manno-octulosonic-acid transferase